MSIEGGKITMHVSFIEDLWLIFKVVLKFVVPFFGLYAALLWRKASLVQLNEPQSSISDNPQSHMFAMQAQISKASELNARAAGWTALVTILGAIASF